MFRKYTQTNLHTEVQPLAGPFALTKIKLYDTNLRPEIPLSYKCAQVKYFQPAQFLLTFPMNKAFCWSDDKICWLYFLYK